MAKEYVVAVVGATGAVGEQMIRLLEKVAFPIKTLLPLASKRSAGKSVTFKEKKVVIEELTATSFAGVDIAFFSAGGSISKQFAPIAAQSGAVVIDNTSAFRMDPATPLVIPEVNELSLLEHNGIIANPNCSTIQMLVALQPIRQAYGLSRIIVSTYQAVSGAGLQAIEELKTQSTAILAGEEPTAEILPVSADQKHFPIAFNALPQIDLFAEDGYTFEEWKMINETKKIMADQSLQVAATCVRIPVVSGHSESVYFEVDQPDITPDQLRTVLAEAPGVVVQDDPTSQIYPTPRDAVGKIETFVGRIRKDLNRANGFHFWVVSDNLLKGAAWNSIQIAESLVRLQAVHGKIK